MAGLEATGAERAEQPFVLEVLDEDEDFADTGVDHEDWDLVVNWCTMESYSFWLPCLGHRVDVAWQAREFTEFLISRW